MNILIKGFYGHRNFGDDLLMVVSVKIAKECFPQSKLHINSDDNYVYALIPEIIKGKPRNPDLIIYGGGGLFFDFKNGNIFSLLKNFFMNKKFLSLYNFTKKLMFKKKPITKTISFCIGIGNYTFKNSRLYASHMAYLNSFEYISVRDTVSYKYGLRANPNINIFTDLVFSKERWNLKDFDITNDLKDYYLFVFRDWIYFDNNLSEEIKIMNSLVSKGKEVRVMLFNPSNDVKVKSIVKKNNFTTIDYSPDNLNECLRVVKNAKLVITQRAHGAIIANVLNTPSICLGVENKLKNVHKMIPNSSLYFDYPLNSEKITANICNNELIETLTSNTFEVNIKNANLINNLVSKIKSLELVE